MEQKISDMEAKSKTNCFAMADCSHRNKIRLFKLI